MMPLSMMSAASSGGVSWSTLRTACVISRSSRAIACTTSFVESSTVFGRPEMRSLPFTAVVSSSGSGVAEPMAIFTSSAVLSPMARLWCFFT